MKLVVDSNILFTFFWKNSVSKDLFKCHILKLYSPVFSLSEINKYSSEIKRKTSLSTKEFTLKLKELKALINFVPIEEYCSLFEKSKGITPDINDIDFVALSLKLSCPIWSNDRELKDQKSFIVLTTKEIIRLIDFKT